MKSNMENIKIKLNGGMMPKKATPFDAAYDMYVPEDVFVNNGRQKIDLKFSIELPHGYAAMIRARSGFSIRGIDVYNATIGIESRLDASVITGLVDEKFRGSVGVILHVFDERTKYFSYVIKKGTRIAQMQIVAVPDTELVESDKLDMTDDRGGGFGHTNK